MNYLENYALWRNAGLPDNVNCELVAIKNNDEELKSRFGSELQFGTAGMRGIMGAGSNRLNNFTVRRAAQGMAAWLSSTDLPQNAAIGNDSRHNLLKFALLLLLRQVFTHGCTIALLQHQCFLLLSVNWVVAVVL